jgi:[acyl-carrier-protein] S-malonyltransferase
MKKAFIFPGQGSQYVGMGKVLYARYQQCKELFDLAEKILEFPLKKICFEGPEDTLKQTQFTQPAIFVHSLSIYQILAKQRILPDAVAGHSLGEYSSLVAAGVLPFENCLRLVKLRGELMQKTGEKFPGTMAAVIGLNEQQIEEICLEASQTGLVNPANFNSPGQVVISGNRAGVQQAMVLAKMKGARLVKELMVSGAFHSPLMKSALTDLTSALMETSFDSPEITFYSNVSAGPVQDPAEIKKLLKKQLLSPVMWQKIIENMGVDGINNFFEIGPSKVLCGLNRRIQPDRPCTSVETIEDLENLMKDF